MNTKRIISTDSTDPTIRYVRKGGRKRWAIITALAALSASIAFLPQPASATTWDSCPSGSTCFFDNSGGGGGWVFQGLSNNVGGSYNDKASSFRNRSTGNRAWRWDVNCHNETAMVLSPGNQQNASWYNNDETSAVCYS